MSKTRNKVAIIGGGVIGGGWTARFLLNGWDVAVYDHDPESRKKIEGILENARRSLPALYDRMLPVEGALSFCTDVDAVLEGAAWVQESVPERLGLKQELHRKLARAAAAEAVIASSTSGFKPSDLNAEGGRSIVAHPFVPVYLLPLVELVGDPTSLEQASKILNGIGMFPLPIQNEIDAHIADRLLEAVWRESLWLVHDKVASTGEIDEAIRMGFGLRWAQMGLFETYRLGGGASGMKHFLKQFGPALEWPWTRLTEVPELSDELVERIAEQSDAQSGHLSIEELEQLRDDNLVGLLRSLKRTAHGAGRILQEHEQQLSHPEHHGLPVTVNRIIPSSWTDYNGHMNETHYLEAGSQATDRFLEMIGVDLDYVSSGYSFFTVENHLRYLQELLAGDRLTLCTQVLGAGGRKLHLYHQFLRQDGEPAASMESLLLHTNMQTRKSCVPGDDVARRLLAYAEAHSKFPLPEGVGRHVGQAR